MLAAFANFITAPLGRLLLSEIFVLAGIDKMMHWDRTYGFMQSKGMPAVAVMLTLAIVFELGGGLLVLLGLWARLGALALIVLLIPATLIFHDFWNADPEQYFAQLGNFQKNVAILGGLFIVLTFGAGPVSIDAVFNRRHTPRLE